MTCSGQATLAESAENAKAALSFKDAQSCWALQPACCSRRAEKAAAYIRHLYDIASSTPASSPRPPKPNWPKCKKSFVSLSTARWKNAPAGTRTPPRWSSRPSTLPTTPTRACTRPQAGRDIATANFSAVTTRGQGLAAAAKSAKRAGLNTTAGCRGAREPYRRPGRHTLVRRDPAVVNDCLLGTF